MSRINAILSVTITAVIWMNAAAPVRAQFGDIELEQQVSSPTFSPYLNIFGGNLGAGPAIGYYGRVRPQQLFYQQAQDLEQGRYGFQGAPIGQDRRSAWNQRSSGTYRMGVTGHGASFMAGGSGAPGGAQNGAGAGTYGDNAFGMDPFNNSQSGPGQSGYQYGAGGFSGHSAGFGSGGSYNQNRRF